MNKHLKALELDKILQTLADYAQTDDGKDQILQLLPAPDLVSARGELKKTEEAHILIAKYASPSFGSLKNVRHATAVSAAGGVLSLRELLDVAELLRVTRAVAGWRQKQDISEPLSVDLYFGALRPQTLLENQITNAISNEETINDSASAALADIRKKIRLQSARIREKLDGILRSQNYRDVLQEAIVTQRNGRFVVPVKAEFRTRLPGLVHDTSSSGSTVFIEPIAVVEANNEIKMLKGKEADEIERILYELSAAVGAMEEEIRNNYECLVELDKIFAKAKYAYAIKAEVPVLNDEGVIDLVRARHPLLNRDTAVPIDVRLGKDFETLVITGPNTGGKTVAIKTIGILCLMAACGLMIPAREGSAVCVFGSVYADIGDEQSIEQSLSTFSSHMVNIIDIIRHADENSLILIDELGAGTDPVEGAALAISILECLHALGAKIAATTHYAELKAYALKTPGIENACCEFDVATLKPTYRLLIGVPGRSNAFAITEKLGMDPSVIERAKELVSSDNTRFEDVVDDLEQRRIRMEADAEKARQLSIDAALNAQKVQERLDEAQKQREKVLSDARGEALRILERSRREAAALMAQIDETKKELKPSEKSAASLSEQKIRLRQALEKADDSSLPAPDMTINALPEGEEIRVGDTVRLIASGAEGQVTKISDRGVIEIVSGSIKMRAKERDVRVLRHMKPEKKNNHVQVKNAGPSRLQAAGDTRCDLRGMTVEEAMSTLDQFLDSMVMTGMQTVTIIHGKGTGALRSAVQQHLRHHAQVKKYRLGVFGEGEDGVTIAELK